jgi:hypothetical protein
VPTAGCRVSRKLAGVERARGPFSRALAEALVLCGNGDLVAQRHHRPEGQPQPSRGTRRGKDEGSLSVFGRIENFFKPFFGGAQVGPAVAPPTPPRPEWVCDVCHQPARAHRFDSSQRGRMYCPPSEPAAD